MTVNYTSLLGLGQPVTGTESGTWGDDVNNAVTAYLDIAIAGTQTLSTDADVTLSLTQGTSTATNIGGTTAQYAILNCTGARTAQRNISVPNASRNFVVLNQTTGGFAVKLRGVTGPTTGVTIANGRYAIVTWAGSDFVVTATNDITALSGTLPVTSGGTGATTLTGLVKGNGAGAFTAVAAPTGTVVGTTDTQTLTNKTLTSPVISTIVNTGTLTLPTITDTILGRTTTDTLTNKSISGASNTLTNIPNGALTNSSVTVNSVAISLGGSGTITAVNPNALTIGTGLSGTSYNGSAAVTIAIDSTVATLTGVQTLTNKSISGSTNTITNLPNSALTNSSLTINGVSISLGGTGTITASVANALTIGTGLSGTSYNGSAAVTIAIDSTVATLTGVQTLTNKSLTTPIVGSGDATGSPVAGTMRGADAAGTNIAGVNFTIRPGVGTGTGAGGSLILQTAPSGASGTTAGTPTNRFVVDSAGAIQTGAASAATGYTSAGDITLPATGKIRAINSAKAWVNFAGASGTVNASWNVSSVTRNSTGDYTINFTNAIADANYTVVGSGTFTSQDSGGGTAFQFGISRYGATPITTSSVRVSTSWANASIDPTTAMAVVLGN